MKISAQGYVRVGSKLEHVILAEAALGRALPLRAEVHHVNEIKTDNSRGNLVLCPDRAYHQLLHYRSRALAACGNAHDCRCEYCKQYDDPANLVRQDRGQAGIRYRHRACHAARQLARKRGNHFSMTWNGVS